VRLWRQLQGAGLGGRELVLLRYSVTSYDLEHPRDRPEIRFGALGWADAFPGQSPLSWLPPSLRPRHRRGAFDGLPSGRYLYAEPVAFRVPLWPGARVTGPMADPYRLLTDRQVRAARAEVGLVLDYWAGRLGVRHGLKAVVVEPDIWYDDHRDREFREYRFVGHLLGEAPEGAGPDPQLRAFLLDYGEPRVGGPDQPYLSVGGLRGRGGLLVQALGRPAVQLFGPEQWPSFEANTRGWPLYRSFGSWRGLAAAAGKAATHDPFARLSPAERALERHNRGRKAAARAAHERLLEAARALWPQVLEAGAGGKRGRPPYRKLLRNLLAGAGFQVTDRQLTGLMAALKGAEG
jgi:hypothetical protein